MTDKKIKELKPQDLRNECDPKIFKFKTTDEVKEKQVLIKQDRTLKAIEFGLNIKSDRFNLYVSGVPGTGRNTTILKMVKEVARKEAVPEDICYLYNFENHDEPKAMKLPAGTGCRFRQDMEEFIAELETEIHKAFSGKDYEDRKNEVMESIKRTQNKLTKNLEKHAGTKGFTIHQSLTGLVVLPLKNGKPIRDRDYAKLSENEKRHLEKIQKEIYGKLHDYSSKVKEIQRKIKKAIAQLDKKIALFTIGHLMDDLKKKYKDSLVINRHLDNILKDMLINLDYFKKGEEPGQLNVIQLEDAKSKLLNKYRVNLLVDNCNTKGAPVIVEDNPAYANLIGKIKHYIQFGILSTDFSMIRPGAVHKANGGYLLLQMEDVLKDYFAWEALKRIIKYKKVKIESIAEKYGLASTAALKPEPVDVELKFILVGSPYLYHVFYNYDEDFRKLFKVKADFDTVMEKNRNTLQKYAQFISSKCKQEKLLPFKNDAVAKIIDYSSRLSGHKEKLTARFIKIADIMRETSYWAKADKANIVEKKHVKKALDEKVYRSGMIEQKLQQLIRENTIFVDTDGTETGQINGLSVMELGDYIFGRPSRITAKTFTGKGEVINIEREIDLSGKIHSKGVMILSSYIGHMFGQDKPLSFSGSICFEQSYDEVEGDSASSTELYCLLSSLAGVPLRQDIAVTGSVNQKGEIQPVGGVNQKIEGFYKVCKIKGLTGNQGVMIPSSNVKHLMLEDEVVEAVREGGFHVYPVKTINQGIEILTGIKPGNRRKDGRFPRGTINYMVDEKLAQYADIAMKFTREEKENK